MIWKVVNCGVIGGGLELTVFFAEECLSCEKSSDWVEKSLDCRDCWPDCDAISDNKSGDFRESSWDPLGWQFRWLDTEDNFTDRVGNSSDLQDSLSNKSVYNSSDFVLRSLDWEDSSEGWEDISVDWEDCSVDGEDGRLDVEDSWLDVDGGWQE